jgi:hypothetical protein
MPAFAKCFSGWHVIDGQHPARNGRVDYYFGQHILPRMDSVQPYSIMYFAACPLNKTWKIGYNTCSPA